MPNRIPVHRPRSFRDDRARRAAHDARRGSAHSRGYTKRWARYSQDRLKRYPWCARCLKSKRYVGATCTDHIDPPDGPEDPRFWDPDNHQSLCGTCHSMKTASEDGGFGNKKRQRSEAHMQPQATSEAGRGGLKSKPTPRRPRTKTNFPTGDIVLGGGLNPQGEVQ